ncbi:AMP-binding protein [Nocardia aurantia]|uniref:Long-chain-fatty-acid--CoA ligase n=1 Tax=Nocardia aurantia TaxID=2585199 RepID=A0A7K0DXA4_9NOCA|nr:AMP-binding protein [Nocardia aurantia]MQY30420.1 Long-chain-fatty-acid--CoA ligase [Nocardia aurantia]
MSEPTTGHPDRPWLSLYRDGQPHDVEPEFANLLDMFADAVRRAPDRDAIRYFDGVIGLADLDAASDALAAALQDLGFAAGDRLALFSQNDPAFVIGMLATWKAGGIAVSVNPMYKERELAHLLRDSGARALLCLDEVHAVARNVLADNTTGVDIVVSFTGRDFQTRDDDRVLGTHPPVGGTHDLVTLLTEYAGRRPAAVAPAAPDDTAFLVYTSGTTGDPKGARLTHANFVFNARSYREWMRLGPDDAILAIAPLFHITGLVGHGILSLLVPAPLVLSHRFHPGVMVDAIREHRPVFTVGAITAFAALAAVPDVGPEDFRSLTKIYSGGAPIAPAVAGKLEVVLGGYIHNAYGLTETSSITHVVPPDRRAPVDPGSGALSIGVPIASVHARIVDENGHDLPPGEVGELLIAGPQVAAGYWRGPGTPATPFPDGELRTGDVGFMDPDGWFYLVDRKKDMIIAAGYKVWPREVEDVLYTHEAVREAAVIGVPDDYRGETVHAVVSLHPGAEITEPDLIAYCKARMAAYKYPRAIRFVPDLPKTASGKILRRELRGS